MPTLPTNRFSSGVPASNSVLFGGTVGPSDTFSESPTENAKLLWPYSPLKS